MRLYGEIIRSTNHAIIPEGLSLRTGAQTMLYLTCTTITSVDQAHYGVSRAKDWVSVDRGTSVLSMLQFPFYMYLVTGDRQFQAANFFCRKLKIIRKIRKKKCVVMYGIADLIFNKSPVHK